MQDLPYPPKPLVEACIENTDATSAMPVRELISKLKRSSLNMVSLAHLSYEEVLVSGPLEAN